MIFNSQYQAMSFAVLTDVFAESVADTVRLVPYLFPIYVLLEYVSHREVPTLVGRLHLGGAAGPVAGALLGVIPQCSMSVMVTSLFATGHVRIGTLLATYLATSDEALPILIAEGRHGGIVAAVVGVKMVIAIAAGYLADFVLHRQPAAAVPPAPGRPISSHTETVSWREILVHGLRHTLLVVSWVLVATFLLGLLLEASGSLSWIRGGSQLGIARVLAVTAFGLIPNCAASVAITEAFLRAGLPFGTAIAGLSAGAGFGLIVLFREVKGGQALLVVAWLFGVAVTSGLILDTFYPLSLPVLR